MNKVLSGEDSVLWISQHVCIKEEYADRLAADKTEITFEVEGVEEFREVAADFENKTYEIGAAEEYSGLKIIKTGVN